MAEHGIDGGVGVFQRLGNHYAFAGGQPVCLDDDGRAFGVHVSVGGGGIFKRLIAGGGDGVAHHEFFGKLFGTFQSRAGGGGAKNGQIVGAEMVDNTGGKRRFGADDGEGDAFFARELGQFFKTFQRAVVQLFFARGARVAGGDKHLRDFGRLRQFPGNGVFAATGADDEDFFHDGRSCVCGIRLGEKRGQ